MENKIVFFDFDGVIVDSFTIAYELNNRAHNSTLSIEEYRRRFDGNIYDHFKPGGQATRSTHTAAFLNFFKLYSPKIMTLDCIAGVDEKIKELSTRYTLCIVSSTLGKTIREYLALRSLNEYFDDVLGPEVNFSKTEKITNFLKERSVPASKSIFITDTLGDIREAARVPVACIGVTWGYHDRATLAQGSPYALIDQPTALVEIVDQYLSK